MDRVVPKKMTEVPMITTRFTCMPGPHMSNSHEHTPCSLQIRAAVLLSMPYHEVAASKLARKGIRALPAERSTAGLVIIALLKLRVLQVELQQKGCYQKKKAINVPRCTRRGRQD